MTTLELNLADRRVPIHVANGALGRLGGIVRDAAPHDRACLVVDENVRDAHGSVARAELEAAGYEIVLCPVVADETRKSLESARVIYDRMLAARLERRSPVVAVGGGITGDLAGFVAATYLRGVPLVQVPTTLLAMVDAAIGGKTGVNVPVPADGGTVLGKNLIGAFWQPEAVVADPDVLATLAPRHLRCGLAESVKHAIIADPGLLELLATPGMDPASADLIRRSASIKVDIVQQDVREAGSRAHLNLGHTFAHAIEAIHELGLLHGEAVGIGLVAAAWCAVATDRLGEDVAERIATVLSGLGLPVALPAGVSVDRLLAAMRYDKKVAGGRLRLVLPRAIGRVEIAEDVPEHAVRRAWHVVGAA